MTAMLASVASEHGTPKSAIAPVYDPSPQHGWSAARSPQPSLGSVLMSLSGCKGRVSQRRDLPAASFGMLHVRVAGLILRGRTSRTCQDERIWFDPQRRRTCQQDRLLVQRPFNAHESCCSGHRSLPWQVTLPANSEYFEKRGGIQKRGRFALWQSLHRPKYTGRPVQAANL